MENNRPMQKRLVIAIHVILAVMELIVAVTQITKNGLSEFSFYTFDSNMLQLCTSLAILSCVIQKKGLPASLVVMQLVSTVCLTITFMISAFVLAPPDKYDRYFLMGMAPIVHLAAPILSIIVLLMSRFEIPRRAVIAPLFATFFYGVVLLILNAMRVVKGPYFFLDVHSTQLNVVVKWIIIIGILCLAITAGYMALHRRLMRKRAA